MIRRLKVLNIIGFLLMIGVNVAVVALPLNDTTTKQIANRYPNLLTPADHTFLIWIVIYFSLLLFSAYQITRSADETVASIGILYFFSALLNSAWLILWHYDQMNISLIVMTILLINLMAIYYKINKERYGTSLLFVRLPFNIYLAWISMAFTAQVAMFLKNIGWNMMGLTEELWMIFVLFIILILTSFMVLKRKDVLFSIVVLWTLSGILIEHLNKFDGSYPFIIGTVIFMSIVIIIENIYNMYRTMSK